MDLPEQRRGDDRRSVEVHDRDRLGEAMTRASSAGWDVLAVLVLDDRRCQVLLGRSPSR